MLGVPWRYRESSIDSVPMPTSRHANWLIEQDGTGRYCVACSHNRTVPDLGIEGNLEAWRKIEAAKHRLFYGLLKLRLPLGPSDAGTDRRLTFDFLASMSKPAAKIMTGHDNGLITLAIEVEDHPLDYGDFEGTIPQGQYGGGTVQLWDRGYWEHDGAGSPAHALREGELKFKLHGERLKGGWVLVRMRGDRFGYDHF